MLTKSLSKTQKKLIKSLHTNKGREASGFCLAEGKKIIEMAGDLVDFRFTEEDSPQFSDLVTTVTPQAEAAVARIPVFELESILKKDIVVILDNVQDPGNVGAILRLCLGFDAGLILIDSVDPTNPKVVRSSAGAMFKTPWIRTSTAEANTLFAKFDRPILRLEKQEGSEAINSAKIKKPVAIIAGSEGQGIRIQTTGANSIHIPHNSQIESLNVGNALAIALFSISTS